MNIRTRLRASSDRLLGAPPATGLGLLLGRSSLRVLAFHGILDVAGFRRQMQWLVGHCTPVTASRVVDALTGSPLPPRAVWVTFDDGHPSVVEMGLPVLASFEIPATMFICPGVIDTNKPFWWQVVEKGIELAIDSDNHTLSNTDLLRAKTLPDPVRRQFVDQVLEKVEEMSGMPFTSPQLSTADLRLWLECGHSLGNHTWDHPMLDQCTHDEQRRQVVLAHDWMVANLDPDLLLFAYPNGNWTEASEEVLRQFGYHAATLFDHRVADVVDPLNISRLRTNADGDLSRFRAIVSGTHPFLHRLMGRL